MMPLSRRRFLSSLFCWTLAVFQGADGQVLDLMSRDEPGGGEGPVGVCVVEMNTTYPEGRYCSEYVDYRYCPAFALPQPNSDNVVWVVGEDIMDTIARANYERIISSVLTKHTSVNEACKQTAQALACFYVYRRAADSNTDLFWVEPCRSVCYEIKSNCWTQEECWKEPAGGCTSKSMASSVRPPGLLWLLFVGGLLSLVLS
eukprot:TRINITY_DN1606_c0_g1_i3.p1 TRINITY_DN1606_c0_g1~~TRINITY_DN1606_c0_g1_i3.p1  ORF type:complete len:202 (+),score=15.65 TRINITY_DN1606_c0_g1_i3:108-713(+)